MKLFNRKAKDSEELQDQEYDASDEDDSEVEDDTEEYSDEEDSDSGDEEFDEEGSDSGDEEVDEEGSDSDDEFDEEDSDSDSEYSDEDEEDDDEDADDALSEGDERKENKLLSLFKSEQDTVYYVLTGIFLAVIVIAIIVLVKNAHTSSAPATPEQVAESQIAAYESEQPDETEISINHAGLDNYTEPSNASTGDAADVSSDAAGSESAASDGSNQNSANSSTSDQDAANANGGTAVADTDTSEAADTKESESAETEALASNEDYVIPDSDTKEYTEDDIRALGLSKDELRIARNEIYARHGREFTSKDLKEYFGAKSWYNPTIPASKFSDNDLTPTELHNKEAIAKVEKSME